MEATYVVLTVFTFIIMIALCVLIAFILSYKTGRYRLKMLLYSATGTIDSLDNSPSYSQLYGFNTKAYIGSDQYSGYFEVTFSEVSSTDSVTLVVKDRNGNNISDEVLITQNKPYKIKFTTEDDSTAVYLFYKTNTTNLIIQERIEIVIF